MDNLENRKVIISINNDFLNGTFMVELDCTKKDSFQKGNSFDDWSWIDNMSMEDIIPFLTSRGKADLDDYIEKDNFFYPYWLRSVLPKNAYIKEIYRFTCAHCGMPLAMLVLEEKEKRNRFFCIKKNLTFYNLIKVLMIGLLILIYIKTPSTTFFQIISTVVLFVGWVKLIKWLF